MVNKASKNRVQKHYRMRKNIVGTTERPRLTDTVEAAKAVGELVAKRAQEKGITSVVFDRGGFLYHGKVAALADGAREAGLQF